MIDHGEKSGAGVVPPPPPRTALLLGHRPYWDPPAALTSVSRWTCPCGDAVLVNGSVVYGAAVERPCDDRPDDTPTIRYRLMAPRRICPGSLDPVWSMESRWARVRGALSAPCPRCCGCMVRIYRAPSGVTGVVDPTGEWRFTSHQQREPMDEGQDL